MCAVQRALLNLFRPDACEQWGLRLGTMIRKYKSRVLEDPGTHNPPLRVVSARRVEPNRYSALV